MARRMVLPALLAALVVAPSAPAAVPAGFNESLVTGGLSSPTAMAMSPDGRIFIAQQGGALRVVKNGALLPTPFVTLSVDPAGERGLLGIAFDPSFASNHFLYVYYTTAASPIHNRVSRFEANGDVAVVGSELPILDLENLSSATNHNGGAIHFGPDGKLYVAVGENANSANSQTLTNRLGKLLRINPDGTIPTDNPWSLDPAVTGANKAIWALGLRNPFTFAFQPGTGRIFVNDVGQSTWEEINDGIAKSNYGWPNCEGACIPPDVRFRDPLFQYGHGISPTTGTAIVGAAFYNPATVQFPADYVGDYFFGDLGSGWIRRFDPQTSAVNAFVTGIDVPVDLAVSADGALYYLSRGAGGLYKVTSSTTLARVWNLTALRHASDIVLRWSAGGDPRVLGFDIYRGSIRLNRALIRPGSRCCTLIDRRAGRGARTYRLEVVLADGSRYAVTRVSVPRSRR